MLDVPEAAFLRAKAAEEVAEAPAVIRLAELAKALGANADELLGAEGVAGY